MILQSEADSGGEKHQHSIEVTWGLHSSVALSFDHTISTTLRIDNRYLYGFDSFVLTSSQWTCSFSLFAFSLCYDDTWFSGSEAGQGHGEISLEISDFPRAMIHSFPAISSTTFKHYGIWSSTWEKKLGVYGGTDEMDIPFSWGSRRKVLNNKGIREHRSTLSHRNFVADLRSAFLKQVFLQDCSVFCLFCNTVYYPR